MSKRVSRKALKNEMLMSEFTENNVVAIKQGSRKKSWNVLDIKSIKPMNEKQRAMIESYFMGNHIVATGSPGTGKSFLALWLALNTIFSKEFNQNKIIIVRSIITTGKSLGALPGDLDEKTAPFEAPYRDICHDLVGKYSSYDDLKEAGKIEFMPTSFIRGLSWDNAIVIIDECQNFSWDELKSVMTRLSGNSKLVIIGDKAQGDLQYEHKVVSGFDKFMKVMNRMDEVDIIYFQKEDIVRSKFVKNFIIACEDLGL